MAQPCLVKLFKAVGHSDACINLFQFDRAQDVSFGSIDNERVETVVKPEVKSTDGPEVQSKGQTGKA